MPTHGSPPPPSDRLFSFAERQLQLQTSRSVALEAGALGLMVLATALGTYLHDSRGVYALWAAALTLLGLSFALAAGALSLPGAEKTGPFAPDMFEARETQDDPQIEAWLVTELTDDLRANRRALARKALLFKTARTLLLLAVTAGLAARL
jgi:hypothetical protein